MLSFNPAKIFTSLWKSESAQHLYLALTLKLNKEKFHCTLWFICATSNRPISDGTLFGNTPVHHSNRETGKYKLGHFKYTVQHAGEYRSTAGHRWSNRQKQAQMLAEQHLKSKGIWWQEGKMIRNKTVTGYSSKMYFLFFSPDVLLLLKSTSAHSEVW